MWPRGRGQTDVYVPSTVSRRFGAETKNYTNTTDLSKTYSSHKNPYSQLRTTLLEAPDTWTAASTSGRSVVTAVSSVLSHWVERFAKKG